MQLATPLETRIREAGISYTEEARNYRYSEKKPRIGLGFHTTISSW
jgi:hypothetical protein